MIAIAVGAGAIAAWRVLSSIDLDRLLALAESLAPLLLGAAAIASALARQRLRSTRRTLAGRRAVAVVPADEFDPKPEAVLHFASQLARGDRSIGGWFDRRASAVRVRLEPDAEGRLVYLVEVPERMGELLRTALRGYPGAELRSPTEALGEREVPPGTEVVRAELVLARPSVEPLARLGFEPDPLSLFAATMSALKLERGEEARVCFDLLPAIGLRRARLRHRLRREARRLQRRQIGGGWWDRLGGEERRRAAGPEESFGLRQISKALEGKLRDAGPLFEAQVLLRCRAAERGRAKTTMQSLLGAFEVLTDQNWLRGAGSPLGGEGFLGSDAPWRRARFDRRIESGLFRPARRNVLTAREVAGFLKPPTVHCPVENVLRSGALLAPAPPLPEFDPEQKDLIPLGRVAGEQGERIVGVRATDTFFTYIAGRSRYGKTETAITMFTHLMRSGQGGLFLDPHGDALSRIEPYLVGLEERVVRIDLGPGGPAAQPGWNLFELGGGDGEARVEAVVDAFASAMEWGERSTRAINLTTQAAGALAAIAAVLPKAMAPTLFQLPTLLSDAEWRRAVLPLLPRASQGFWLDRFPLLSAEAITPLTNMVDRLRASRQISTLLGQSESSFRVREAMEHRQIVLACPGSGGTRDRLLANLLLFDVLHAARSRGALAPERRTPFWVFLDEVQSYDGAASGNLAALLEQAAKFGIRAVLMNQNPERLQAATLNALTTNRSHLLSSALNSHAAALLTKEWGGQPSPAALTRLPRYRFIAQVTHEGELSRPFALGGVRVEDALGEPPVAEGPVAPSPAASSTEVLAHQETLDERIAEELRSIAKAGEVSGSKEPAEHVQPAETVWLDEENSDG
ncbi:MAG: hypothetical protein JJE35_04000 [Thermoleophilia bacterium]|nr:hypothetical protein [Thermoleophilia bacterium]